MPSEAESDLQRQWRLTGSVRNCLNSPGHFHQGHGHSSGIDGQVSIQVYNEAEVEHIDANCRVITNRENYANAQDNNILSKPDWYFFHVASPEPD